MPIRIQRKRVKGFRLPNGVVCVTRPSPFGNPFKPSEDVSPERCVKFFRECLERAIYGQSLPASPIGGSLPDEVIEHFRNMAWRLKDGQLRGKDLACWCKADAVCHADVLLDLAQSD